MIKIEYIYIKNDTKNTKSGSCVLCIILYFIVFLKYVYLVFVSPDVRIRKRASQSGKWSQSGKVINRNPLASSCTVSPAGSIC